jgi:hypothetical protein
MKKTLELLDINKAKHHIAGWREVRNVFHKSNQFFDFESGASLADKTKVFLVSFMSEFLINPDINQKKLKYKILEDKPWIGIDHLVNNPGPYFKDMWSQQPHTSLDLINEYDKLGLLKNCKAMIFMSENQKNIASHFKALKNIPTFGLMHPIISNNPTVFKPELYLQDKRHVVQLGWSQRNHSFFNDFKLNPDKFKKSFMFGSLKSTQPYCYKHQAFEEDLKYHKSTLSCEVLPMLSDQECNNILSKSIVFLNLYDAVANNGILDCIERCTPVIVNRSPSSEEYLGKDYPLFYNNNSSREEILTLFRDKRIIKAHKYLLNLDKTKFSINKFMNSIKKIANI